MKNTHINTRGAAGVAFVVHLGSPDAPSGLEDSFSVGLFVLEEGLDPF